MIVEFIGLPGSGKTFISEHLICERDFVIAEKENITFWNKFITVISVLFTRVYLTFFIKIIFSFQNTVVKLRRLFVLSFLSNYVTVKSKICVYDQYFLQYLISFYYVTNIKPNRKDFNRLIRKNKLPNNLLVIYNDVDLKIIAERFQLRKAGLNHNRTQLDNLDISQYLKSIGKLKLLSDVVFDMLKELNIKVVHLTNYNQDDFDVLRQRIKNKINENDK